MEARSLDQLYQEIIREHSKDPRNWGEWSHPNAQGKGYNPLCGDHIVLHIKITPQKSAPTIQIRFKSEACSICTASASMMTEAVEGQTPQGALKTIQDFRNIMQGKEDSGPLLEGDIESLKGVRHFPVRIKCALLPWTTLKEALETLPQKGEAK